MILPSLEILLFPTFPSSFLLPFGYRWVSRNDLVNPPLLQPPHLLPERLDLLPAVQRATVVLLQTPHHLAARLLHAVGQRLQLFPLVQARAQRLDFLRHGRLALLLLGGLVRGERRDFLGRGFEELGGLRFQLAQLRGYARLDGEFEGLRAGGVGLLFGIYLVSNGAVICMGGFGWRRGGSSPRYLTGGTRRHRGRRLRVRIYG